MSDLRLDLRDVVVSFDGLTVLNRLTFGLARGETRFIIGPNGAGKTTLLDVVTGRTRPRSGAARFEGHDLTRLQEHAIARLGIGRKFQTPTVFPSLTALQNLEIAASARRGITGALGGLTAAEQRAIGDTLDLVGLKPRADIRGGLLSHGEKQWLEIGMLAVQEPKLLLLDEPVAGMTRAERDKTGYLLERLRDADPDRTIVVVEHDMAFVRQFARTVTVLHLGSVLSEGTIDEVQGDPRVIDVYLGHGRRKVA